MLAVLAAPFGRIAAAEATIIGHHAPMATAGHCQDMPSPDQKQSDKAAIDCMIACAAVATADGASPVMPAPVADAPAAVPLTLFSGLHPEADPPPPRFS